MLDSVGIGEMPDAAAYGDAGSDTLGNIARQRPLRLPNMLRLGLGKIPRNCSVPVVGATLMEAKSRRPACGNPSSLDRPK